MSKCIFRRGAENVEPWIIIMMIVVKINVIIMAVI